MLTKMDLIKDLQTIGIKEGMVLVVHTSLKKIGYVDGGPIVVIESILEILGQAGTLVMPAMTSGDEVFDPTSTPTDGMGIVAETFWKMPGVVRSSHPNSSFAAYGKYANDIVAEHPLADSEGINSPLGKVYQLDGRILLLGTSHDSNTMIHLAESLNRVPYRTISRLPIIYNGTVEMKDVPMINHCCQNFCKIEAELTHKNLLTYLQIGTGIGQFMKAKDVIDVASEKIRENPFYFLCEKDCDECMEAREYAMTHVKDSSKKY